MIQATADAEMTEAHALYEQGIQAQKAGDLKQALKCYKAAARSDSTFRPAFNNLGVLYARARRPDLAIGFFKRALDLGEDAAVNSNLGSEHFRLEQLAESEAYLIKALKLDRRLVRAHILLAYLYGKQGRHDRANIYFQNALKIEPANRPAALGLAVALSEQENYQAAFELVESFLKLTPADSTFKNLRAGLLLKLDHYKESMAAYGELTRTSESFTSLTDHLAAARQEQEADHEKIFGGIDDKIRARTARLRRRIAAKKEDRPSPVGNGGEGLQQDLKDMVDLSFLHLFNGDSEKAVAFLLQARKMKKNARPED